MRNIRTLKRVLDHVRSEDLAKALESADWVASGSKAERVDRVLDAVFDGDISLDGVLDYAYKSDLVGMCEALELKSTGTREVVQNRIVKWFRLEFGHRLGGKDEHDSASSAKRPDHDRLPVKLIGQSRLERLLKSACPLTMGEKRQALRKLGYRVEGATNAVIAGQLIEFTGSVEGALDAAMKLWLEVATPNDVKTMRKIAKRGGPPPRVLSPAISRFFRMGGKPSYLGKWVLGYLTNKTEPRAPDRANTPILSSTAHEIETPKDEHSFQGRTEHRALQDALCKLGRMRGLIPRTNHSIGDFRPDVLWYKLHPDEHPQAGAHGTCQ